MVEGGEGTRGASFGVRSIDDEDKDFMIPFCRGAGCRGHESMTPHPSIFFFFFPSCHEQAKSTFPRHSPEMDRKSHNVFLHIYKRLPILRADQLSIVPILEKCLDHRTAVSIVTETERELFVVAMCMFSSVGNLLPFPASLGHSIRCQYCLYSLYGESCDIFQRARGCSQCRIGKRCYIRGRYPYACCSRWSERPRTRSSGLGWR